MAKVAQAVGGKAREDLARKADRAKLFCLECITAGLKLVADEGIIKVYIVRNKDIPLQVGKDFFGNILKARRILHHLVVYPRESLDVAGNVLAGIDQCF